MEAGALDCTLSQGLTIFLFPIATYKIENIYVSLPTFEYA